jgi:hypothetical protein
MVAIAILLIFCGVIVVVGGKKLEQAVTNHPVAHKSPSPKPRVTPSPQATFPSTSTLAIHVAGNRLVDGRGRTVQLRGVNRSGAESGCVRGDDRGRLVPIAGPTDAKSVAAIKSWHANAVRIPLKELLAGHQRGQSKRQRGNLSERNRWIREPHQRCRYVRDPRPALECP